MKPPDRPPERGTPQLDLRERLDLYRRLRPIYLCHPLDSPLRDRAAGSRVPLTEIVKVSFGHTPPAYAPPNQVHWNLFEAAANCNHMSWGGRCSALNRRL